MPSLTARVDAARHDPAWVVLEGVHALKHALRFDAVVEVVASPDPAGLHDLLAEVAPDIQGPDVESVDAGTWDAVTRGGLPSPVLALARRPADRLDAVLGVRHGHVVVLEDPTHLGNVGAAVRVAAAAGAAGLLVVGSADPWHPRAVRGGAGLQFALPVGRRDDLPTTARPLVALDPDGDDAVHAPLPAGALLAFGTERHGLTDHLLATADQRLRLPMRQGVSSLNLATAVAAVLYGPAATPTTP